MIFRPAPNTRPFRRSALSIAMLVALGTQMAYAQARPEPRGQCWERPAPETLEETFKTSTSRSARQRQAQAEQSQPANAALLISNGSLKVAYSAGLLVGWGDTGERPRFAAITAVGTSALIAPFAFLGQAGDQAIADIFNCEARDIGEVAENAASFLDDGVLAAIAREYDAGRRLFIALPGSAARPETVWDIGLLAKKRPPDALALARDVLRASVTLHKPMEPGEAHKAFARTFPRNPVFRESGTGQEFLLPPQLAPAARIGNRYFLIHNDRLFWDDSAEYVRIRNATLDAGAPRPALMPGYDIVQQALAAKGSFRFASPKTAAGLVPDGEFDAAYLKGLFRYAYRQGRMDKSWTAEFPGLRSGAPGL